MKDSTLISAARRALGNRLWRQACPLLIALASGVCGSSAIADPYGLTSAQPIGAYLNGALPSTTRDKTAAQNRQPHCPP